MAGICCLDCVLCVWYMWPDDRKHGSVCAVISGALTCVERIWVCLYKGNCTLRRGRPPPSTSMYSITAWKVPVNTCIHTATRTSCLSLSRYWWSFHRLVHRRTVRFCGGASSLSVLARVQSESETRMKWHFFPNGKMYRGLEQSYVIHFSCFHALFLALTITRRTSSVYHTLMCIYTDAWSPVKWFIYECVCENSLKRENRTV